MSSNTNETFQERKAREAREYIARHPLEHACSTNDVEGLTRMLATFKITVENPDPQGIRYIRVPSPSMVPKIETLFALAIIGKATDVIKLLSKIFSELSLGDVPTLSAIKSLDSATLKACLEYDRKIASFEWNVNTALGYYCDATQVDTKVGIKLAQLLLDFGADPNHRAVRLGEMAPDGLYNTEAMRSPIRIAIETQQPLEFLVMLLDHGAFLDTNTLDLALATSRSKAVVMMLLNRLIAAGARIETDTLELGIAVEQDREVLNRMLQGGARVRSSTIRAAQQASRADMLKAFEGARVFEPGVGTWGAAVLAMILVWQYTGIRGYLPRVMGGGN